MDVLLIVLGMTLQYCYQRYRERVYKRKVRPLEYFSNTLAAAVVAMDEHIAPMVTVRLTRPENRNRLTYQTVNQTLVEIVNVKKLPPGYVGQFFEHLMLDGRGSAPLWIDRVTLLPTTSSVRATLDVATTDRSHIIKFNPKLIRADLLAAVLNFYFGILEK